MPNNPEEIKSRMIDDALVILSSVGFMEKEINRNFSLLEEAINNHFIEDVPIIEQRIHQLLAKINDENRHMDEFMEKYRKEIFDEKKAILSGVK